MAMVSCTEDYTDWSKPQVNAEPKAVEFGNGSVTAVDVINLANVTEEKVQVASIVAPTSSDAGYTPTIKINLGDKTYDIDNDGKMATADLATYISETYGKRPIERDINATLDAWISNGSTVVKMATSETFQVKAIPVAPVIEEGYYLVGDMFNVKDVDDVLVFDGWNNVSAKQAFKHSDKDVYDDPFFTLTFETKEANQYWKIIPQTNYDGDFWANGETGVVGVVNDGDSSFEGNLTTNNPGAGKLEEASIYRLTINMMEYTYKLEKLNFQEYFYEIGNESGWATPHALYGPNFDGKYQGYYWLDGEFKFKPNKDNWLDDYEYDGEGKIADIPGGPNCPDPGAGFYQIDVDLAASTYSITKVKSITCVGNHNGWNQADAAQHMTYNSAEGCWELTTTLTNGFKFAMNDEWTVSWGGANGDPSSYGNLTQNGGKDLNAPEGDGVYEIKLYLSYEGNNKVVFTKK